MIYRVILKIAYVEAHFDFDDLAEAGNFAQQILVKMVDSEDCKRKPFVRIEIINPAAKEQEED